MPKHTDSNRQAWCVWYNQHIMISCHMWYMLPCFHFLVWCINPLRLDEAEPRGAARRLRGKLSVIGASELANIAALDCCALFLVDTMLACSVLSVFCCVMMALTFSPKSS